MESIAGPRAFLCLVARTRSFLLDCLQNCKISKHFGFQSYLEATTRNICICKA